jgi:hypothetical protein
VIYITAAAAAGHEEQMMEFGFKGETIYLGDDMTSGSNKNVSFSSRTADRRVVNVLATRQFVQATFHFTHHGKQGGFRV